MKTPSPIILIAVFAPHLCFAKINVSLCAQLARLVGKAEHVPLVFDKQVRRPGEPRTSLDDFNLSLPVEFRAIAKELGQAHGAGKPLSRENHRVFAQAVVQYLARRGISASISEDSKGYYIKIEGRSQKWDEASEQAKHLAALQKDLEQEAQVGFYTDNLLNALAGRGGIARYKTKPSELGLSIKDLLGSKLSSHALHEVGHLKRGRGKDQPPQFKIANHKWAPGSIAAEVYKRFSLEEVSTTYPISIEEESRIALKLIDESRQLSGFPQLQQAVRDAALAAFNRTLLEARLMTEFYAATGSTFINFNKIDVGKLKIQRIEGGSYDRAITLPSGEIIRFKSEQIDAWVRRSYGLPENKKNKAWSFNPVLIREALRQENVLMESQLRQVLAKVSELLAVPEFKEHWKW